VAFDLLDYLNDLYFASPDGSDTRPGMTPGLFISVDAPLFSPDGEYLYFSATGPGPEAAALPPSGNDRTWLDRLLGVQVAYANGMPSEWWRLSLTGDNPAGLKATGDPVRLTAIGASGLSGAFSPDRRLLAFISYGGMGLLDLEGGRVTWIYPATTFGSVIWLP
jgi:Tol biopolymer transport system component